MTTVTIAVASAIATPGANQSAAANMAYPAHYPRHAPRPKATTAGHGGGSANATGFAGRSRQKCSSRHKQKRLATAVAAFMPQALQAVHGGSGAHATRNSGRPRRLRRSRHRHFRPSTAAAPLTPQAFQAIHIGSATPAASNTTVGVTAIVGSAAPTTGPPLTPPVEIEAPPCAVALRAAARASDHQLTQTEVTLRCIRLYTAPGGPHGSPT